VRERENKDNTIYIVLHRDGDSDIVCIYEFVYFIRKCQYSAKSCTVKTNIITVIKSMWLRWTIYVVGFIGELRNVK
jgi:hypothetical protein